MERLEISTVCVFCGSSSGRNEVYRAAARRMGRLLAEQGIRLVYGGGNNGLMGEIASASLENHGRVIGVIPEALAEKELAHQGVTELHVVRSMHARKAMMAELSDAFVALPGGYGTLEELCEIITWSQLGLHRKPCGILNVDGFFDPLLAQFRQASEFGFIPPKQLQLVVSATAPEELLELIKRPVPSADQRYLRSSDT